MVKNYVGYQYLESFVNDFLFTVPYQSYIGGLIFRPVATHKSNKNFLLVLNKQKFHDFDMNNNDYDQSSRLVLVILNFH
jgi:hypothetical protein